LDVDTTIVGAGPYGLSLAAHLRARRSPFELLGTPLESWRSFMPKGMVLKSERFASNLWDPGRRFTLKRYCESRGLAYQPVGSPVSLAEFLQYADWFREQAVGEARNVKVIRVQRAPRGFGVHLADGTYFTSRQVVLATGHMDFRVLPPELSGLPEPLVLHSARIGDVKLYAGREVCIIGAGQSALETAAILHEQGARVRVLARRDRLEWNPVSKPRPLLSRILSPDAGVAAGWKSVAVSELPRTFRWLVRPERRHWFVARAYGPSGSWWLRQRIENRVEIHLNSRVSSAAVTAGGSVRLRVHSSDGVRDITAEHVVAATGFRVDIDRVQYLDPSLARSIAREVDGIPALDSRFGTSVPGLFIVGLPSAPVFGPIMRFMYGAKHVAPVLARCLRSRLA
jgi:thioredoxin reductase